MSDDREDAIRGTCARRVQKRQVNPGAVTRAKRERFLAVLGETCNVRRAAKAAEVEATSFYRLRRNDPAFAAEWDQAMADGYERLESVLLSRALGEGDPAEEGIDAHLAAKLLGRRDGHGAAGGRRGSRNRAVEMPIEEVEAALMRRLEALARRVAPHQAAIPLLAHDR